MNSRENGHAICKEFTVRLKGILQVVYKQRSQNRSLQNTWTNSFPRSVWPFKSILCFQYFEKSPKTFKSFPDISWRLNFRINPSWKFLSNAFYLSKNAPLTPLTLSLLILLSKDWCISWVIEGSWFTQESLGRKPDWLDDSKSCLLKTWTVYWIKVSQRSHWRSGSKETGR